MGTPGDKTKLADKQLEQAQQKQKAEQYRKIAEAVKVKEAQKAAAKAKANEAQKGAEKAAGSAGAVEKKKAEIRRPLIESVGKEHRDAVRRPGDKASKTGGAFGGEQVGKRRPLIEKVQPKQRDEQVSDGAADGASKRDQAREKGAKWGPLRSMTLPYHRMVDKAGESATPWTRADFAKDKTLPMSRLNLPERISDSTPEFLRPSRLTVDLGDGRQTRISTADIERLRGQKVRQEFPSGGEKTISKPEEVGELLLLRDPETGSRHWINQNAISEGCQTLNNNWVYRDKERLEALPHYPEDRQTVADFVRKSQGLSLAEQPDTKLVDNLQKTNRDLNTWMSQYLGQGESISSAKEKVWNRALNNLKSEMLKVLRTVMDLSQQGVHLSVTRGTSAGSRTVRGGRRIEPDKEVTSVRNPEKGTPPGLKATDITGARVTELPRELPAHEPGSGISRKSSVEIRGGERPTQRRSTPEEIEKVWRQEVAEREAQTPQPGREVDLLEQHGVGARKPPEIRLQEAKRGIKFDTDEGAKYPKNQVPIRDKGGKIRRLDSYKVPSEGEEGEIISRKSLEAADGQIAFVDDLEMIKHFQEFALKYPNGAKIANTPAARKMGLAGQTLSGKYVLEVPEQRWAIPDRILKEAKARGVTIRDINGKVYEYKGND